MPKNLQKTGHRERDYDRPTRKWLCGHSKDGLECPLGPSAKGKCRGSGECLPALKDGRWYCTRPDSAGGECETGPCPDGQCGCSLTTCQPTRSLREVRKLVSIGVVLLTVGVLLATLSSGPHDSAFVAGRLTTAHAGEQMECRRCHTESSLGSLESAADPHFLKGRALNNSQLCLDCHENEIGSWQESARYSHGWSPTKLESKTVAAKKSANDTEQAFAGKAEVALWIASKGPLRKNGATGQLACATCHQEHEGSSHNLTDLSDKQCQVCHEKQFHSFDKGHPTFAQTNYPYSRRTRIFFDHGSHYQKHFGDSSKATIKGYDQERPFATGESCTHCHQPNKKGAFMRLRGYDASCGACHQESVMGGDALTMLAIPAIDQSVAQGNWPTSGGLIPPMRLLLDESQEKAVSKLNNEDDYGVVSLTGESHAKLGGAIASDLQSLFFDTWNQGSGVLATRLDKNSFHRVGNNEALFEGLSVDTVRRFLFPGTQWKLSDFVFPKLDLKTLNERLKKKGRSIGLWPKTEFPLTAALQHLLMYRPGISDDLEVLKKLTDDEGLMKLSALANPSDEEISAIENIAWEIKEIFSELRISGAPYMKQYQSLSGGIMEEGSDEAVLNKVFINAYKDKLFSNGLDQELFDYSQSRYPTAIKGGSSRGKRASNAAKKDAPTDDDDFGDDDAAKKNAPTDDDDFGDDDAAKKNAPADDDDFGDDDAPKKTDGKQQGITPKFEAFEPNFVDWQSAGGWFYDEHAIHYRSAGHADPLIKAWIEAALATLNSQDAKSLKWKNARRVIDHTFGGKEGVLSEASGKCFKCHTVDRDSASDKYKVNWVGAYGTPKAINPSSDLTRFSHAKHLIGQDCNACHTPQETNTYRDFFPRGGKSNKLLDPRNYASFFKPIDEKTNCASCHQKSKAGNNCLQCHDYHSNAAKFSGSLRSK
ncbi:MAG: cytochrome c3 family protein [Verrucomicrobia bacterium]|nr:cytochrome c3 family protein [Verrucomicrobiota bacterium]